MKEGKRIIPVKNYLIILLICAFSILLIFFIRKQYRTYVEYSNSVSILDGVISEVHYKEINDYISENLNTIIYIDDATDNNSRELEKELKTLIEKEKLKDKIIYYNIARENDQNKILREFNLLYIDDGKITHYPAIVIINDGKVENYRAKTATKNLTIDDVKSLLSQYKIIGDIND